MKPDANIIYDQPADRVGGPCLKKNKIPASERKNRFFMTRDELFASFGKHDKEMDRKKDYYHKTKTPPQDTEGKTVTIK